MPEPTAKPELTAVLYADVAAYSRLASRELGTHRRVMAVLDNASQSIERARMIRARAYSGLAENPDIGCGRIFALPPYRDRQDASRCRALLGAAGIPE